MKKFFSVVTLATILVSIYMVYAEEAAPKALSCPNCDGGGWIETVGPTHAKYQYDSPCGVHPGYYYVVEAEVRTHSFRCSRCGYTESYDEIIKTYFAYCRSGQSHQGIDS